MSDRPLLIMLRTGGQLFREYLLRSISAHYRVHMFLGVEPTWEVPYVTGTTVVADTLDAPAMIVIGKEIHARTPVSGVMTWAEARTPQAAQIAAALGLPGGDGEPIARCRDKHLTRRALAAAGVPQPQSVLVSSADEAVSAAGRFGYPVIVKPTDLAVSIGVAQAATPDQVRDRFAVTSALKVPELPGYQAQVLIEEFAGGPEISVDSAVHAGRVHPLFVAHKEIGYPPYCVEMGHYVDGNDPLLDDPDLHKLLDDAHAAIGFQDGVTHTEIKLTATGPKIIEINARLGGDLIPYLGLRATGVDTGLAAAAVACGRPPQTERQLNLVAGVRFFHVEADDTLIKDIGFARDQLPSTVDRVEVLAQPGERRMTPPKAPLNCRIAFATAVADSRETCRDALDAAEAALVVAHQIDG